MIPLLWCCGTSITRLRIHLRFVLPWRQSLPWYPTTCGIRGTCHYTTGSNWINSSSFVKSGKVSLHDRKQMNWFFILHSDACLDLLNTSCLLGIWCINIYILAEWVFQTIMQNILGKLAQYHGCWCPGDLCHQVISSHGIDFVLR